MLGICLQISSCKNKSNSNNPTDSVSEKILPPKDINSPVILKEVRSYTSGNGSIQNGIITEYDNCYYKRIYTYNNDGYLTHFFDDAGKFSQDFDLKYDFSDESYSYSYQGSEKNVYGKDGNLLKTLLDGELACLYKYNSKGQIISKTFYKEGKWTDKELTSYDGDIKTTLEIHNEGGKEEKQKETEEKFDKEGNVIEKTEYIYNKGIKRKDNYIVYDSDRMSSTYYSYVVSGSIHHKIVSMYNSHGEDIKEYFYDVNDNSGDFSTETRREYDKYGNPTLEIRKNIYSPDRKCI